MTVQQSTSGVRRAPHRELQERVALFKAGMRKLASGVALITSADDEHRAGLVATAVNSVSMDPPTLLVCVNQSASAHDVIDRSGIVSVNLLSAADVELCDVFGCSTRRDERFKVGEWNTTVFGAPRLLTALAVFDCEVVHKITHGTHTIFLGEVHDVHVADANEVEPLLYMDRAFMQLKKFEAAQLR